MADNDQESILAVPPSGFFTKRKITVDENLINEHVLQLVSEDGKEMTSLSGKAYCLNADETISLIDDDDTDSSRKKPNKLKVSVRLRDTYFTANQKSFKRVFISNCLDQRYFDKDDQSGASSQHDISRRLKDPYE